MGYLQFFSFFLLHFLPDTIASVGRRGIFASKKLDAQFARSLETDAVVPQTTSDIGTPAPAFDPEFVFTTARPEWVDSKWVQPNPTALLERARGVALLPNRKVIAKYYVDFGESHETTPNLSIVLDEDRTMMTVPRDCSGTYSFKQLKERRKSITNASLVYKFASANIDATRKQARDDHPHGFSPTTGSYEFEVDNYLNLYHAASRCYIMCNTTPFPDVAFYGMVYWKPEVFRTRRNPAAEFFQFTAAEASLVDKRAAFIANLAKVMPDNYEKVFKFADGWRKLPGYQTALADLGTEGEVEIDGDADLDGADGSTEGLAEKSEERTLLKLTQDRLLIALKRSDAAEATAREIGGIFQTKLVELTEACLELEKERAASAAAAAATASAKAAVLEASAAGEAAAKKHSERLEAEIRKSAGHEQEAMAARAALTASENQLALQVATGNSVDTLQADYSKTLRECDKIRALNAALVKELQGERKAGRSGNTEKQSLTAQLLQLQLQGEESKDLAATLKAEIANVTAENAKISGMLAEAASSAGGALEQALTDRISTLEEQLKESTAARTEAEAAQTKSTADYTRLVAQIKSNFSGL